MATGRAAKKRFTIKNEAVRQCLAEFLGTFVLVAVGTGGVAQMKLAELDSLTVIPSYAGMAAAWFIAITMGVYIAGPVSGGHLNPAITFAVAVLGRMPFWKFPVYALGQYLGAFAGAASVYGVYSNALDSICAGAREVPGGGGTCITADIFATYPNGAWLNPGGGLGDQLFSSSIIMMCILAIVPKEGFGDRLGISAISIGLIFGGVGLAFGLNCNFAVNPARDFAPRLLSLAVGYGAETFQAYNYFFLVPIIGPHVGMVIGSGMYMMFVGSHAEAIQEEEEEAARAALEEEEEEGELKEVTTEDGEGDGAAAITDGEAAEENGEEAHDEADSKEGGEEGGDGGGVGGGEESGEGGGEESGEGGGEGEGEAKTEEKSDPPAEPEA